MPTIEELERQFEFKPRPTRFEDDVRFTNHRMSSSNVRFRFARCLEGLEEMGNWRSGRTKFVSCTCRGAECNHTFYRGDYFWWGPHMPIGQRTLCPDCYRRMTQGPNSQRSENDNKILTLV